MDEDKQTENTISDEFRNLGQNLVNAMRGVWDSPERKRLQQEVEEGLAQLSKTVKMEVDTFNDSPAGQRLRTDVEDFRERVRSGEAEVKIREEILKVLRFVNSELEKTSPKTSPAETDEASEENNIGS